MQMLSPLVCRAPSVFMRRSLGLEKNKSWNQLNFVPLVLFQCVFSKSSSSSFWCCFDIVWWREQCFFTRWKKDKNVRHHLRFENKAGDEARVFLFFKVNLSDNKTLNISTNWYCFVIFHLHTKVTVPPGPKKKKKSLNVINEQTSYWSLVSPQPRAPVVVVRCTTCDPLIPL